MGTTIAEVKATMASIKGRIRSQMDVMSADLGKERILWRSLVRKLGRTETDWGEVENHYTHILSVIGDEEDEDERNAHEQFQTQLFTLMGWVQDAIDRARGEEEAQENANRKVSRLRLLGERWGGAYHRIETVLAQLKTRLEGEPINNLELLEVKSTQVDEIKEQIIAAAAIVEAMFTADPDQEVVTLDTQATRRTAVEVTVHECEELVTTMKAAINARITADAESCCSRCSRHRRTPCCGSRGACSHDEDNAKIRATIAA